MVVSPTFPDLTIILDVPAELGLGRAHSRRFDKVNPDTEADAYEKRDLAFHWKLRDAFREIARAEPERCVAHRRRAGRAQRLRRRVARRAHAAAGAGTIMARAPVPAEIEELPEADRLEGFPHPRETKEVFGHAGAERMLAEALAGGRMHHAWLLAGPQGIGKATLAYRFARAALAAPEERDVFGQSLAVADETSAARQVRALSHPGLLVIRRPYDVKAKRFATSIPVDEVRRLRSFLAHRAAGDGWRVVIVDEANELNVNAANALLKSLEEPPARTVFLLVSSAPGTPRADHPLALPHAHAAAARRRSAACRRHAGARQPPTRRRPPLPNGRRSSASPRAAPAACSVYSAQAASSCRRASPSSLACCRRSTGAPCTRFPTSYNPSPRRPVSSCSSSCC